MLNRRPLTLPVLLAAAMLAACSPDRGPACNSPEGDEALHDALYSLLSNAFALEPSHDGATQHAAKPTGDVSSNRVLVAYAPFASVRRDIAWLSHHLETTMPPDLGVQRLPLHLSLHDYRLLRQAVEIRVTNRRKLPDRTEGSQVDKNVCSASVDFRPKGREPWPVAPLAITYSIKARPKASRWTGRPSIYVPVVIHSAADENLLPLSEQEKGWLRMMGLAQGPAATPFPQTPLEMVSARALHALRAHHESPSSQDSASVSTP